MTVDDCMRAAFQALLRGDTAERDRYCDLANNLLAMQERMQRSGVASEAIQIGAPIMLPDRSGETLN